MTKDETKRAALIEKLADHMLAHGLAASSLRPLAKAAGTSDRMLLYYFEDKDALIAAALQNVAARMVELMDARTPPAPLPPDSLLAHLSGVLDDAAFWPYMRLWLEVASRAANGDAGLARIGNMVARGFLAWGRSLIASDNPDRDAARLLVMVEGTVFLRAIGLDNVNATALGSS